MNDEFQMTNGAGGRCPVAGESGVDATALPPQSKIATGWPGGWD